MFRDLATVPPTRNESPVSTITGVQCVADFTDCRCAPGMLLQSTLLEQACCAAVEASGLTPVATRFHQFEPGGATGVVLLAESHLAIHTWPESGFVSIDLYVCNFTRDNTDRARALLQRLRALFKPAAPVEQWVERGKVQRHE